MKVINDMEIRAEKGEKEIRGEEINGGRDVKIMQIC